MLPRLCFSSLSHPYSHCQTLLAEATCSCTHAFGASCAARVPTVTLGSSCADIPLRGVGTAVFEDLGANQKNFSSKYADGIISAAVASNVR